MTQDEIIDMAIQAGASPDEKIWLMYAEELEAFAKLVAAKAIAELESQEPVAWADLQKEAQQIVESKALWKKLIDGTPLANDIACWMTDFALQHTHPPQRTEPKVCCQQYDICLEPCTPRGRHLAQRTWVGLTDEDIDQGLLRSNHALQTAGAWRDGVEWATKQLKEKNI